MTVMAPDTLDWVTFSTDDHVCTSLSGCSAEAVCRVIWRPVCPCAHHTSELCVTHRDEVLTGAKIADGFFRCRACGSLVTLVRIEPIR